MIEAPVIPQHTSDDVSVSSKLHSLGAVLARHQHEAPSDRLHSAALDFIEMLRGKGCPEDVLFAIAAAPALADERGSVDFDEDAKQIRSTGRLHTPFALVRAEMHQILIQDALDDLVAAGLAEVVFDDDDES